MFSLKVCHLGTRISGKKRGQVTELVGLETEYLFLDTRRLKILGKGRKERIVPLGHWTRRLLGRYIHHLRPEPLFKDRVLLTSEGYPTTENTVKMVIQRLARRANVPLLHAT